MSSLLLHTNHEVGLLHSMAYAMGANLEAEDLWYCQNRVMYNRHNYPNETQKQSMLDEGVGAG